MVAWFAFGKDTMSRTEFDTFREQTRADNRRTEDSLNAIRSSVDEMKGILKARQDAPDDGRRR